MIPRSVSNAKPSWSASVQGIGVIHSPFSEAPGTPVQNYAAHAHEGGLREIADLVAAPFRDVRGSRGTLEVTPEWEEALQDLEGCPRIWILFWVHRAAQPRTKVLPYRDTVERGLFSTRAPARPNPIGLSCVRLLGIRGRFVHVAELDALNGSPLLDIKPYVDACDAFPGVFPGWFGSPTATPGAVVADGRFETGAR